MDVTGTIILPTSIRKEGKIYIRIQDTSMMDAPAITIAEQALKYTGQGDKLSFTLQVKMKVDVHSNYTLFVHLDLDHDGQLSKGDWMHSHAYPAIENGQPLTDLVIHLREIG